MASASTKDLLDALLQGAPSPMPFPEGTLQRARALCDHAAPQPQEVIALPEPLALAVLESTVRRKATSLALALAESGPKPLVKAAKKALYRLRSTGTALPEPGLPPRPHPAPSSTSTPEEFPTLLSPLSGTGERAMLLVRPIRGGGLQLFQMVVSDTLGLIHLTPAEVSRSTYRKQLRELRQGATPLVEMELARTKAFLASAAGANLSSRTPFPPGVEDLLRHLEVSPSEERPALPEPTPDDERAALRGDALHQQPEIAGWLPPEPLMRLLAARLDEAESSPLQLSSAQKQERLLQKVAQTAHEFFVPQMRRLYAHRLWQTAEVFDASHRIEAAQLARACARRLFHLEAPSRFAEFLFEKVLLLSQQAQAQSAHGPSTPSPPPEGAPSGGLILP